MAAGESLPLPPNVLLVSSFCALPEVKTSRNVAAAKIR
jgi:hypothetical protein